MRGVEKAIPSVVGKQTVLTESAQIQVGARCAGEQEFARVVVDAGEDGLQISDADVLGENFAKHRADVLCELCALSLCVLCV